MNDTYTDGTKAKILQAAHACFSEAGYNGTSVRDIVARAGTNIASVNYHFGGKEALYKQVIESTFEWMSASHEFPNDNQNTDNFEHLITAFVKRRILENYQDNPGSPPRLIGWEIVDQKLNVKSMMDKRMEQTEQKLALLLSPLFGPHISDAQKSYAARWFFTFITPPPHLRDGFWRLLGATWTEQDLDIAVSQLADAAIAVVKSLATTSINTTSSNKTSTNKEVP